jgi:biopolymer transport protein ExbB
MTFDLIHIFQQMSLFQWLVVGTLLIMAISSTAVVLDRLLVFARSRGSGRKFAAAATALLDRREYDRLAAEGSGLKSCHLARMLAAGAKTYAEASRKAPGPISPAELARRELDRQREVIDAELRRGMGVLSSTGSVAPFVGLLGTVVGIIAAFEGIAKEGSGGLGAVSAGIAEALIVTALGLLVAIPAVMLFNFLSTKADKLMLAIDQAASQLADHLDAGHAPVAAPPNGAEANARERAGAPEADFARA